MDVQMHLAVRKEAFQVGEVGEGLAHQDSHCGPTVALEGQGGQGALNALAGGEILAPTRQEVVRQQPSHGVEELWRCLLLQQ